jgi:hypothetical protein
LLYHSAIAGGRWGPTPLEGGSVETSGGSSLFSALAGESVNGGLPGLGLVFVLVLVLVLVLVSERKTLLIRSPRVHYTREKYPGQALSGANEDLPGGG